MEKEELGSTITKHGGKRIQKDSIVATGNVCLICESPILSSSDRPIKIRKEKTFCSSACRKIGIRLKTLKFIKPMSPLKAN